MREGSDGRWTNGTAMGRRNGTAFGNRKQHDGRWEGSAGVPVSHAAHLTALMAAFAPTSVFVRGALLRTGPAFAPVGIATCDGSTPSWARPIWTRHASA